MTAPRGALVAATDDYHALTTDRNDVIERRHQFPQVRAKRKATSIGKMFEGVAGRNQTHCQFDASTWAELHEIIEPTLNLTERRGKPDDPHDQAVGGGTFSPLASFKSHSRTRSWGTA